MIKITTNKKYNKDISDARQVGYKTAKSVASNEIARVLLSSYNGNVNIFTDYIAEVLSKLAFSGIIAMEDAIEITNEFARVAGENKTNKKKLKKLKVKSRK